MTYSIETANILTYRSPELELAENLKAQALSELFHFFFEPNTGSLRHLAALRLLRPDLFKILSQIDVKDFIKSEDLQAKLFDFLDFELTRPALKSSPFGLDVYFYDQGPRVISNISAFQPEGTNLILRDLIDGEVYPKFYLHRKYLAGQPLEPIEFKVIDDQIWIQSPKALHPLESWN